ncbi:MAG TPA: FtsX-like permease family protein [Candidatus Kapabacteria bacterium]|nr:FtsX-like permease family protein [Candidatus Kapabacteria bacterium]
MSLAINIGIAKTHLLSRKKQSLIAMLGVTFGIAMFIFMISFMKGVNEFLSDTMLSSTPDIHIYNDISTDYSKSIAGEYFRDSSVTVSVSHPKPKEVTINIKNAYDIVADLKHDPSVLAVSPYLSTQAFYNYGPVQINGMIEGVDILQEDHLYKLHEKMSSGKLENLLTTDYGILMGQGLADKLNVRMGDLVSLATPNGTSMRFRIVGTFKIGIGQIDNVKSYVNIPTVQQLLEKDRNYITDIAIKLTNIKYARAEAALMSRKYNYTAEDWETANSSVTTSNLIRDILTIVVSVTLLVVAGFGIYNIMNMTIASKMKDIAILKAEGFARRDIAQIFLSQSLAIGILGALTGIALGFMLSYAMSNVPFPKNEFIGLKYFPVIFEARYYIFGFGFGVLTTFFAGVLPSVKASKVDPVAILRG